MGLPYTALDLAVLLSLQDLGVKEEAALLEKIWAEEQSFLALELVASKRTFLLDVAYWALYLREKPCIDREFPMIQQDAVDCGANLSKDAFLSDFSNLDLYFKGVRFRLRFFSDSGYIRIKFRTLLGCGHGKAVRLLAELDSAKGIGLIERVRQGQGRPTKIFVKQFTTVEVPDFPCPPPPTGGEPMPTSTKMGCQEVPKADGQK